MVVSNDNNKGSPQNQGVNDLSTQKIIDTPLTPHDLSTQKIIDTPLTPRTYEGKLYYGANKSSPKNQVP